METPAVAITEFQANPALIWNHFGRARIPLFSFSTANLASQARRSTCEDTAESPTGPSSGLPGLCAGRNGCPAAGMLRDGFRMFLRHPSTSLRKDSRAARCVANQGQAVHFHARRPRHRTVPENSGMPRLVGCCKSDTIEFMRLLSVTAFLTTVTCILYAQLPQSSTRQIDLAALLAAGKLRPSNRTATPLAGMSGAVHVSEAAGPGAIWIPDSHFTEGAIDIEIRGRDVLQQSFPGIAFHGAGENSYEVAYLRPFNFRAEDPERHRHAIQYASLPDFDWPLLREKFPNEFERAVDASVAPTDWVNLHVEIRGQNIRIRAGAATNTVMEVRKLGTLTDGMIGLWVGNNSDGDFRNLRITPAR